LESAFVEKSGGRVVMPPKHWLERGNNRFYSAMSCYIPAWKAAGCKWQSVDSDSFRHDLRCILGLYILNDDETGLPMAIIDSTWITDMRTAAASALTARYLSRENSVTVAILGCGVQGRTNLSALMETIPTLTSAYVYDIRPEIAAEFSRSMGEALAIEVFSVRTPREAVERGDIIISATAIRNPSEPVIEADWLSPGALGIALDYDSYWTVEAIRNMDLVVADDQGQIDHLKETGLFQGVQHVDAEIGDVITGKSPGRTGERQRILAFNLGLAIEDLPTAMEIYRRAAEKKKGTKLNL